MTRNSNQVGFRSPSQVPGRDAQSKASKFVIQCLSQHGELLVYKVDLGQRQTQLISKVNPNAEPQRSQNGGKREQIVDHLIHAGSNEYSILLTDQGNLHFYHIY